MFINSKKIISAFNFALRGFLSFLKSENNAKIHLLAAFASFLSGLYFKIDNIEWIAISITIALVFITEILNTAIEKLVDYISPAYNKKAGEIKDIAAAAVLLSAITAVCIGLFIFLPKIFR